MWLWYGIFVLFTDIGVEKFWNPYPLRCKLRVNREWFSSFWGNWSGGPIDGLVFGFLVSFHVIPSLNSPRTSCRRNALDPHPDTNIWEEGMKMNDCEKFRIWETYVCWGQERRQTAWWVWQWPSMSSLFTFCLMHPCGQQRRMAISQRLVWENLWAHELVLGLLLLLYKLFEFAPNTDSKAITCLCLERPHWPRWCNLWWPCSLDCGVATRPILPKVKSPLQSVVAGASRGLWPTGVRLTSGPPLICLSSSVVPYSGS